MSALSLTKISLNNRSPKQFTNTIQKNTLFNLDNDIKDVNNCTNTSLNILNLNQGEVDLHNCSFFSVDIHEVNNIKQNRDWQNMPPRYKRYIAMFLNTSG